MTSLNNKNIWIDLDNSPHVPFFRPIIDELNKRGYEVVLTARNAYQVCELADRFHMNYKQIGHHYGKNKILKVIGFLIRSVQFAPYIIKMKPVLALSHGSRSQVAIAKLLGITSIVIFDYEYTSVMIDPDFVMMPDLIFDSAVKSDKIKIYKYPGIKEDVYIPSFKPDSSIRDFLGIDEDEIVVTVRPPAIEAHYHSSKSEELFEEIIEYLLLKEKIQIILLPRNGKQEKMVRNLWKKWFDTRKVIIPEHAVDGLNLIWFSDLVVSGGGTMNREAAALGVPVYSIFRGKIGAVDRYLANNGRLVLIESIDDFRSKVKLIPRVKKGTMERTADNTLQWIVENIIKIVEEVT